jgi:HEAT repeat protein
MSHVKSLTRGAAVALVTLATTLGAGRAESSSAATPAPVKVERPRLDRAALLVTIAEAKARSPQTFEALAHVREKVEALDRVKRGPLAPLTSHLSNLGPDAFAALVERVITPDQQLSGSAARAFRVGLVEALGALRDARALPVLAPLLDDTDDLVARTAAAGVGKLSDDASLQLLLGRLDRVPVVLGAGHCRRRAMAAALAALVAGRASPAMVKAAAQALGDLGSAWAWSTGLRHAAEKDEARAIATAALLDAFVGFDGEVRQAASNALMVVDDPSTPARISAAKAMASTPTLAALDKLAARFARNPARL